MVDYMDPADPRWDALVNGMGQIEPPTETPIGPMPYLPGPVLPPDWWDR